MAISQRRKRGWPSTALAANASMATRPPSPRLSARSTKVTYLSETMTVTVHTTSDSTPYTWAVVSATWPELKTSLSAYSTLVPISPYTTPKAPRVRAANDDFSDCTNKACRCDGRHCLSSRLRRRWPYKAMLHAGVCAARGLQRKALFGRYEKHSCLRLLYQR